MYCMMDMATLHATMQSKNGIFLSWRRCNSAAYSTLHMVGPVSFCFSEV